MTRMSTATAGPAASGDGFTPGRAFAIMAREAPRAVSLRRGPTDWVQLSLWHTDTDQMER